MCNIATEGAIVPLVRLLRSPRDGCREASAWALRNLACHEDNIPLIFKAGGAIDLVNLLESFGCQENEWRIEEAAASALGGLASCAGNKRVLGEVGAVERLIQLMRANTNSR
jgi:hypothetical protein